MQARQLHRIPTVGLHPIPRSLRHKRGSHHIAAHPQPAELPVHRVSARPRFVADLELVTRTQPLHQSLDRLGTVGNLAEVFDVRRGVAMRDRDGDRLLVDIEPDVHHPVGHDRSLPYVALRSLCRERNLRSTRWDRSSHLV